MCQPSFTPGGLPQLDHNSLCIICIYQISLSARVVEGMGLWDAESPERHWAYLGKFASLTKGMTDQNRTALLSQANRHVIRKAFGKLGGFHRTSIIYIILQNMQIKSFHFTVQADLKLIAVSASPH